MSKQKASKPPKDPNAPVKPPSAFFIYLREEQLGVRREMERGGNSVSNDIVAKECGRRWRELDPQLKQRYHDEHLMHKMRYEQEMMVYKQSPDVVAAANIANIAKNAKQKNPAIDLPQMFKDYFNFLISNWQTVALGMPNDSPADVQQTIWNIWSGSRVVTKDETAPLDTNFNLTQLLQPDISLSHDDSKEVDTGNSPLTLRPKVTPPKLAFHFFVDAIKEQTSYQRNPLSESQIIRLCQERWDAMSEEEMKHFNVLELKDMGRYERELARANRQLQETPTPGPAASSSARRRKRPVREAAVKAVSHVSGTDDDEDTRVKVKKEKHDPSYNNDDSKVKTVKMERMDTPYKSYNHQGVLGDDLDLGDDENSDNDKGKLEINENYVSDEY